MNFKIAIKDPKIIPQLLGAGDCNLAVLKECFKIPISVVKDEITYVMDGNKKNEVLEKTIYLLTKIISNNNKIKQRDVIFIIDAVKKGKEDELLDLYLKKDIICRTKLGQNIFPKSFNQKLYYDYMKKYNLVFAIGPAGTGKTFLAVAYSARLLKEGKVKKIILTRPAVEAGESLGFLPGDLKEKVDPYLRPLYDALYDMFGKKMADEYLKSEIIEIAPLAYMRGRTLENAFVILDEAQNTTYAQMKMFLTRMGFNSKMLITGDITQIDLPRGVKSGLSEAVKILNGEDQIKIVKFDTIDVVRHPLVQKIIKRYDEYESSNRKP